MYSATRLVPTLICAQGTPTPLHVESPVSAETAPAKREGRSRMMQRMTMKTAVRSKEERVRVGACGRIMAGEQDGRMSRGPVPERQLMCEAC
jgi:hypothetical protein